MAENDQFYIRRKRVIDQTYSANQLRQLAKQKQLRGTDEVATDPLGPWIRCNSPKLRSLLEEEDLFLIRRPTVLGPAPGSALDKLYREGQLQPFDEISTSSTGPWKAYKKLDSRYDAASDLKKRQIDAKEGPRVRTRKSPAAVAIDQSSYAGPFIFSAAGSVVTLLSLLFFSNPDDANTSFLVYALQYPAVLLASLACWSLCLWFTALAFVRASEHSEGAALLHCMAGAACLTFPLFAPMLIYDDTPRGSSGYGSEISRIIAAKDAVKLQCNYPDTVQFHTLSTSVSGSLVTLRFTAKNAFGVPSTETVTVDTSKL